MTGSLIHTTLTGYSVTSDQYLEERGRLQCHELEHATARDDRLDGTDLSTPQEDEFDCLSRCRVTGDPVPAPPMADILQSWSREIPRSARVTAVMRTRASNHSITPSNTPPHTLGQGDTGFLSLCAKVITASDAHTQPETHVQHCRRGDAGRRCALQSTLYATSGHTWLGRNWAERSTPQSCTRSVQCGDVTSQL